VGKNKLSNLVVSHAVPFCVIITPTFLSLERVLTGNEAKFAMVEVSFCDNNEIHKHKQRGFIARSLSTYVSIRIHYGINVTLHLFKRYHGYALCIYDYLCPYYHEYLCEVGKKRVLLENCSVNTSIARQRKPQQFAPAATMKNHGTMATMFYMWSVPREYKRSRVIVGRNVTSHLR
jgi:hypothetical protein